MCASAIAFAALALITAPASAQIDSSLFSVRWQTGEHWAETIDKIVFIPSVNTDHAGTGGNSDLTVFDWDSTGHIRTRRDDASPVLTFGYRFLNLSLGGDGLAAVADDLNDLAIVGAYKFGHEEDDWRLGVLAGAGTANDGHWMNEHAVYGVAAIDFEHRIDADRVLHLGVEYYGNRLYQPNVPMPVVRYEQRMNKDFVFTVGFPTCLATWNVWDAFTLDAEWTLASRARLTGSFELSDKWSLFGEFEHDADGFFLNGTDDDRLFYEFSRIMAGVRWKSKYIDAALGVGYAFNQEFTVGDNLWSAKGRADASDGMAIVLTLRGTF